jgi:hypothetical protein
MTAYGLYTTLELCADVIVSAAARRPFFVVGGGAPVSSVGGAK